MTPEEIEQLNDLLADQHRATYPLEAMTRLAADGWCVVLKTMPPGFPWILEGSRSEYDAPSPDTHIVAKWCAEASDVRREGTWRHSEFAMADSPQAALTKLESLVEEKGPIKVVEEVRNDNSI